MDILNRLLLFNSKPNRDSVGSTIIISSPSNFFSNLLRIHPLKIIKDTNDIVRPISIDILNHCGPYTRKIIRYIGKFT